MRACVRCIFKLVKCKPQPSTFFSNNERYENFNALSFGVNHNSVAQKMRILAIKAIFDPVTVNIKRLSPSNSP